MAWRDEVAEGVGVALGTGVGIGAGVGRVGGGAVVPAARPVAEDQRQACGRLRQMPTLRPRPIASCDPANRVSSDGPISS